MQAPVSVLRVAALPGWNGHLAFLHATAYELALLITSYVLVAALFFGGCTHYHVTPAGAPRPDRVGAPAPEPIEPLELNIGRPSGGQLLLQTNRPAYVAIFEIVPDRGVTLIYPAAMHQQNIK
jgi:hypothetical protein